MGQGFTKSITLDTDGTLAANSNMLVSSQKAVKTYVDASVVNQVPFISGSDTTGLYIKRVTTPASHTGNTSETQLLSITIPANTFAAGGILSIPKMLIQKTNTAAAQATVRIKLSTSNTMPAGTTDQVARIAFGANNLHNGISRTWSLYGGNLVGFPTDTSALTDLSASTVTVASTAFDPTVTQYLYVSATLVDAGDTLTLHHLILQNF